MLSDGFWLLVIGISVVFVFLILLVAAIQAASLLLRKLPGDDSEATPVSGGAPAASPPVVEKIAAILASIADRSRKGS
jgi:sodium pump decarboxylase gamma subunit